MYKAVHKLTDQEFILLNPIWKKRINDLRVLDRKDLLVCQGCRQPVRVRTGNVRRWHFAHKHLENCTFQEDSPELLEARALLYDLLVSQVNIGTVTLEKAMAGVDLPRPVDCWVELDKDIPAAYWIIEHRLNPIDRQTLQSAFRTLKIKIHWILVSSILHEDDSVPGQVYLSTTEREFAALSLYDLPQLPSEHIYYAGSIHYLDVKKKNLITYRALHPIHATQAYRGQKLISSIQDIQLALRNGELIHPGEAETLIKYQEKMKKMDQVRYERLQEARNIFKNTSKHQTKINSSTDDLPMDAVHLEEAVCMFCGQLTLNYWFLDRKTKRCKCRECLSRGLF